MKRSQLWVLNDLFKRKLFLKMELKKTIFKSLLKNKYLPQTNKYYVYYKKNKINRSFSIIQQKNKCVKTGRVWATAPYTKYSRFVFRNESYIGNLPAFNRASW